MCMCVRVYVCVCECVRVCMYVGVHGWIKQFQKGFYTNAYAGEKQMKTDEQQMKTDEKQTKNRKKRNKGRRSETIKFIHT